jgi:hypothetical protein
MKTRQALKKMRFVSCARGVRLLQVPAQAAGCAPTGGIFLTTPAGRGFGGRKNLTRSGIYRGKISPRNNQITSKKKRHRHPIK